MCLRNVIEKDVVETMHLTSICMYVCMYKMVGDVMKIEKNGQTKLIKSISQISGLLLESVICRGVAPNF